MDDFALTSPQLQFEASNPFSEGVLKLRKWTKEEDERVIQARNVLGESAPWAKIADLVTGRSGAECRDRFRKNIVKSARWRKRAQSAAPDNGKLPAQEMNEHALEEFSFEAILGLGEQAHLGSVVTTEDGHDLLSSLMLQGGLYPSEVEEPDSAKQPQLPQQSEPVPSPVTACAIVQVQEPRVELPRAPRGVVRFKDIDVSVQRFQSIRENNGSISKAVLRAPITKLSYLNHCYSRQEPLSSTFKKINAQMASPPKPKRMRRGAPPECNAESMEPIPGVSKGMLFNSCAIRS